MPGVKVFDQDKGIVRKKDVPLRLALGVVDRTSTVWRLRPVKYGSEYIQLPILRVNSFTILTYHCDNAAYYYGEGRNRVLNVRLCSTGTNGLVGDVAPRDLDWVRYSLNAQLMFDHLDQEQKGVLSSYHAETRLGDLGLSSGEVNTIFALLDSEENGEINKAEWLSALHREDEHEAIVKMVSLMQPLILTAQ